MGPAFALLLTGSLVAAEPATARRYRADHAVEQAGGSARAADGCSQCRRSACPQCRLAAGHQLGHGQCEHGLCPAHCPVRPDVFGFYGTRWRRWPGSGVFPASNNEAAAPARPPQTEVPGASEESLEPELEPKPESAFEEDGPQSLPAPAASEVPDERTRSSSRKAASNAPIGDRLIGGREDLPEAAGASRSDMLATGKSEDAGEETAEKNVSRTAWRTFTSTGLPASARSQGEETR